MYYSYFKLNNVFVNWTCERERICRCVAGTVVDRTGKLKGINSETVVIILMAMHLILEDVYGGIILVFTCRDMTWQYQYISTSHGQIVLSTFWWSEWSVVSKWRRWRRTIGRKRRVRGRMSWQMLLKDVGRNVLCSHKVAPFCWYYSRHKIWLLLCRSLLSKSIFCYRRSEDFVWIRL